MTTKFLTLPLLLAALLIPAQAQQSAPPLAQIKAAAEAGDAGAQDKLGDAYGYPSSQAETWYRKAAAQGVVNSQYRLGCLLLLRAEGFMATRASRATNGDEAVKWLTLAAAQGDNRAQLDLGRVLRDGKLVQQDYVEAYKWSALAARGGPFDPTAVGGRMQRDSLILKMSTAQIAEGQRRAEAFVPHRPTVAELPEPAYVRQLKLQGISGNAARRLAIINNHTFQKGEQAQVKAGDQTVTLNCLEIREKSVVVAVSGLAGTRELKLSTP